MNKIRKVIKFHTEGKSKLFISRYLSLSRNTVKKYISLYDSLSLSPDELKSKTDSELESLFAYTKSEEISPKLEVLQGFFPRMERELSKTGVTIHHMWEQYISQNPDGFKISQFRHHFRIWSKDVKPVMHIQHKSGDKMYVDYAGKTLKIKEKDSEHTREVQFFIAILGASQYTYAEASLSQQKADFVQSIENALHFFQGVPTAIVTDNLKSAVIKSNRYEPTINETLADFAEHYETTILPTRAYKPRDKALVEGAVKILYRRIYAFIKESDCGSLKSLNTQIRKLLDDHNAKKFTARPYSRKDLFLEDEKKELLPLAQQKFEIKNQSFATVAQNGHVQLGCDKNYYSVPYQYIRKKVKILYTSSSIEIYYKYNRIALHRRNYKPYAYTTVADHLSSSHQFMSEWNEERFLDWGRKIDEIVCEYILKVLESKNYPEQAYKSCLGILHLEKKVGKERLINACKRALEFNSYSYKALQKILENNLDDPSFNPEEERENKLPEHSNIRGKHYYH
ncbi:IS21 family transposase [Chryseobacterium sp.]|uniref:IS21 family transposase n=1 Tax=Chryseobacterium sp. TaxID=1871047 RepID=UPI0028A11409|nr:IS21 family transposase [Chryseobacterium sp.]